MLVTKKKHLLELQNKDVEIKKLEDLVNNLVLSEVDLKTEKNQLEDKIRFLNRKAENRDEQIERLELYLEKVSKSSEEQIQHLEQKLECRDDEIICLKDFSINCEQIIKQFEMNSINKLKLNADKTKKKRLKKKMQKIHDEKLINLIINIIGGDNV